MTDALLWLPLVAFAAGFIDAIAGGGGLLTVPALLSAGLPPHLALGTNKLAATFGSSTAAFTFYRKRLFQPQHWLVAALATAIGAVLGVLVISHLDARWLEKLLPLLIGATALYTLLMPTPAITVGQPAAPAPASRQSLQGLLLGAYDGGFGPGTGAFWTVSNLWLHRLDMLRASGLARAMNFISNGVSLVTFAWLGHIHWQLGLAMGVALMAGAYLGAHSAIRFGSRFIRPVFILVVMLMATKLAWEAWL